jgi:hypothetical protein
MRERRRKEEEVIERDLGRTKTARRTDECLQLHCHGPLDRSKNAMAYMGKETCKCPTVGVARGENVFPGTAVARR